jgi:hypothetical protein
MDWDTFWAIFSKTHLVTLALILTRVGGLRLSSHARILANFSSLAGLPDFSWYNI